MYKIKLNNGNIMPILGYGTFKIDNDAVYDCVINALDVGYRRIDTAQFYANEKGIGRALKASGLAREDCFITSKLWTSANTYTNTLKAVDERLQFLGLDYLDLLLIHWPIPSNLQVWDAMQKGVSDGKLKAIGVSNFAEHHLQELLQNCTIPPVLNQVELHPLFQQNKLREYCKGHNITVEAWSPLLRGDALVMPKLTQIAEKYSKSVSQIILRYLVEEGIAVIPKTVNKERMKENINIFDFTLNNADKIAIAALDINKRQYRDPDNHGF